MNLSISALRINSLSKSPVFSGSESKMAHFTTFKNIEAQKLVNSFYFSSFEKNLKISQSKFKNCLNTVIRMGEIGFDNSTRYNRIEGSDDSGSIEISNCVFYKITTLNAEGGALHLKYKTNLNSKVTLYANGFYFCSSSKSCGALSIEASNFYGSMNCFSNCISSEQKMIGAINGRLKNNIEFNSTSSYHCAPTVDDGLSNTINLNMGAHITYFNNFTSNYLSKSYPSFVLCPTDDSQSCYTTIDSCDALAFMMLYPTLTNTLRVYKYLIINNVIKGDLIDTFGLNIIIDEFTVYKNVLQNEKKIVISKGDKHNLNIAIINCQFDNEFEIQPNKDATIKTQNNVLISIKNFVPITHTIVPSAQCWVNMIEKPKSVIEFVIQWKRTLILIAVMVGLVLIAVISKRLYQNFTIVSKKPVYDDNEVIIRNNNDSAFNYQYDFDMI